MRRPALYTLIGASLLLGLGSGRAVFLQLAALFAALLPLSYTWGLDGHAWDQPATPHPDAPLASRSRAG